MRLEKGKVGSGTWYKRGMEERGGVENYTGFKYLIADNGTKLE